MPDLYDVTRLDVRDSIPIVWQVLPDLTFTDGNRRTFQCRDYINAPVSTARFRVVNGYTLIDGWTYDNSTGELGYNPILGRTIRLRFRARRDNVPWVLSTELSITRKQAFIERLVPNRIVIGLGFNAASQRVYVFNGTDIGITPNRDYINAFDVDGNEQLSESLDTTDVTGQSGRDAPAGGCFDGTHFWTSATNSSRTQSSLTKLNADGTENAHYTVSYTPIQIESLTFDGTYIWGLDLRNYQLRKFSRSGVEQSGGITLPRAQHASDYDGYNFTQAQYGLAFADDHFYIPQSHITGETWIFCCTTAGVRVRDRDIETEHAVSGLTYNPTTENLWWIYDREDEDGNRFGILEAEHI